MRRVIQAFSVVLALAIVLGAAIPAWAADEVAGQEQVEVSAAVSEELDGMMFAPQTFDFGLVAAAAAVVSLAGFAISGKRS
ncbi:MAG: hypothetical protein II889_04105 [Clostridia bacterium]|nr:hypothetical protein [Clostridia bacterium]MCR4904452.1 hypothetical protein [Clostridiales bacterium]